jgi:hypothetical protein
MLTDVLGVTFRTSPAATGDEESQEELYMPICPPPQLFAVHVVCGLISEYRRAVW